MEFFVFLLIMGAIFANVVKQSSGKKKPVRRGTPPYAPSAPAPAAAPRAEPATRPAPEAAMRRPFAAPPAAGAPGAAPGHPYAPAAQTEVPCDDGHGSIAHTSHEGKEQPAAKAPAAPKTAAAFKSAMPEHIAPAETEDMPAPVDDEAPQLLGMELDAQAMQRAVVLSEILNKRGGRHGWART